MRRKKTKKESYKARICLRHIQKRGQTKSPKDGKTKEGTGSIY